MSFYPSFARLQVLIIFLVNIIGLSISIPATLDNEIAVKGSENNCKRREFFHNETQACYKDRSKGPCTGNMIFLKLDKVYGDCECILESSLPWVYHPETNDCYETYKQSYCSDGQWLIFDNALKPTCVQNSCKDQTTLGVDEDHPTVLFKNKCVTLNKPSKLCESESDEIGIKSWEVVPKCIQTIAEQSVISTTELKCRPGSKRDINGICRRTITISASEE